MELAKIYRSMQDLLAPRSDLKPYRKTQLALDSQRKLPTIEIAMIGGLGFHRHLQKSENEIFVTSLYEIDRIIEEKQRSPEQEKLAEEQTIRATIPTEYLEYVNSAEELEAAKQYIVDNLHKGFLVPSTAPFASPILIARKPRGGLRFYVDYRKLNALTKKDRYPLPLIDELLQRVNKAKFFTKLDIRQGFYRIRMAIDSEDLTTFRSRYGLFKYKVIPFGLTNGPAIFQRYINIALGEYLNDFITAYVDNILIYSESYEDHIRHRPRPYPW
ncbi:hypothetical protein PENANT_c063G05271, partial [Penicillium antarcticum]